MKRIIDYYLLQWKNNSYDRKSLLLRGARQIGKTYAVREFGKTFENYVEINFERFEKNHAVYQIFEGTLNPQVMVKKIEEALSVTIIPGKTLLFIDEVQLIPRAIISLRYFYEEMPELHVIAAGSLLDFAIQQVGVPVGRVTSLEMHPLSFIEYLAAKKQYHYISSILQHEPQQNIEKIMHDQYLKEFNQYLIVGGMPKTIQALVDQQDLSIIAQTHTDILKTYRQDFEKYAKQYQIKYVETIFNEIPRQLGNKFKFDVIEGQYRKQDLSPALDLLKTACIVHKVFYSAGQGMPLGAQRDDRDYKVIFLDIGLAQTGLGNNLVQSLALPQQDFINKGAIAEAFVGQELTVYNQPLLDSNLYYWHKDSPPQAEIDYVAAIDFKVIPIEVKAGTGSTLQSLHYFLENHKQSPYGIKFSTQNYSMLKDEEKGYIIHSYPLYAIAKVIADHNPKMKAAIENLIE